MNISNTNHAHGLPPIAYYPQQKDIFSNLKAARSKVEFIEILYIILDKEAPGFFSSKERLENAFKNLSAPTYSHNPLLVAHASCTDPDDLLSCKLYALMIELGAIHPDFFKIVGVSNPIGLDSTSTAQEYLQHHNFSIPNHCYHAADSAVILSFSGKPREVREFSYLSPAHRPGREYLRPIEERWIATLKESKAPAIFVLGAAASSLQNIFYNLDTLPFAIQKAETLAREKQAKESMTTSYQQVFSELLAKEIDQNPSLYLHPQLLGEDKKPVSLQHLKIQFQGTSGMGQNQSFLTITRSDGKFASTSEYKSVSQNPHTLFPDAYLLEHVLKKQFGLTLVYYGSNPKINVSELVQKNLGQKGLDLLAIEDVETFKQEELGLYFASLLLNRSTFTNFFLAKEKTSDLSLAFSPTVHPYRTLLDILTKATSVGVDVRQILQGNNTKPRRIIKESIDRISQEISNPSMKECLSSLEVPIEEKIHAILSGFFLNPPSPTWNPYTDQWKDYIDQWASLPNRGEALPKISDCERALIDAWQEKEIGSLTMQQLFALELLQLVKDGIVAQSTCIRLGVKGTGQDCYTAVQSCCRKEFIGMLDKAVGVGPYDVSNALEAFDITDCEEKKDIIKLLLLKKEIFSKYKALPS